MAELNVVPRGGAGVRITVAPRGCILRWPPKGQGVRITSVPRGGTVMESSVAP